MDKHIDPNWTMANDLLSVHVGINTRLWICRQEKTIPICIMLGREHTQIFLKEKRWPAIPKHQIYYKSGKRCIPIEFNSPGLYGIATESMPKPGGKACRKRNLS
jgi:hypothetical protein